MTTSNPPTVVEALIEYQRHVHEQNGAFYFAGEAEEMVRVVVQALQLHGGEESRSDFASGSVDTLPEMLERLAEHFSREAKAIKLSDYKPGAPRDFNSGRQYAYLTAASYLTAEARETSYQALSGGGEANPKPETPSNPILQGPTREELHQAFVEAASAWAKFPDERSLNDHIIDSLLALLNPTSPWRDDEAPAVPLLATRFDEASGAWVAAVVTGPLSHPFKLWQPLVLPALPGGENP